VVAISHCSNTTGVYAPVEAMVAMAKRAGALVVLDAAQSVAHRRLEVASLGADFIAFSAHKMIGPTGIGVLYGRRDRLDELVPAYIGGGTVDWVDLEGHKLRKVPHCFEAGTPDIAGVYGIAAAIRYLQRVGFDAIGAHDAALAKQMLDHAARRDYLQILGPGPEVERAGILSMAFPGRESVADIARMLSDSYGVMCRSGHLCAQPYVDAQTPGEVLRASAYFYNTSAEVDRLFAALDEIQGRLRKPSAARART
jgi:cysteine desulfurase/selenocysteine lyase